MRIVTVDTKRNKSAGSAADYSSVSFARDWRDLALLFAIILDIPSGPLGDITIAPSRVADHASAAEVKLLRAMLERYPNALNRRASRGCWKPLPRS